MTQFNFIKDIAKYGLENDQEKLLSVLNELIDHSRKTKKINFALQLQSILKEAIREHKSSSSTLMKVGSDAYYNKVDERELSEFIIEKLTSDYSFENLVCNDNVKTELSHFIEEHQSVEMLQRFNLPISNKIILHGPSGCGKTLASYVIAGELHKMMVVVNLGAIVSSKLGETSKNLSKIFRKAAAEDCIIFIDEFDSLGKVRDYSQDHGEMKRVVNTILQLFDYLPQSSIVIAATNQIDMIDDALMRRFDMNIKFDMPNDAQIKELVSKTLKNGLFRFNKSVTSTLKKCVGLSYYSIQKTLITAIKRSLFANNSSNKITPISGVIDVDIWNALILHEKIALKPSKKR